MNAIEQGIITVTTKEKLMQYESDKANLETRITKLKTRTIQPLDRALQRHSCTILKTEIIQNLKTDLDC